MTEVTRFSKDSHLFQWFYSTTRSHWLFSCESILDLHVRIADSENTFLSSSSSQASSRCWEFSKFLNKWSLEVWWMLKCQISKNWLSMSISFQRRLRTHCLSQNSNSRQNWGDAKLISHFSVVDRVAVGSGLGQLFWPNPTHRDSIPMGQIGSGFHWLGWNLDERVTNFETSLIRLDHIRSD